jgi:hypothetical protein
VTDSTVTKLVSAIESGDVLVGSSGGRTLVEDVADSSAMPGLRRVETEHGHLYMDPEAEVEVLTDNSESEGEYEWGVRYHSNWTGENVTEWGYSVDPRTNGVIDEEGDVKINLDYHPVIAVGRRPKGSEIWENV